MGLLETYLEKIPKDVRLVAMVKKRELAEIQIEGNEIVIEVKSPLLIVETVLKQLMEKKVESSTLSRFQNLGYKVKVRYKGIEFDL